jgi:hypothetical protein
MMVLFFLFFRSDISRMTNSLTFVSRLGKKVDNNNSEGENTHITRSRPLLITFSNESVKKTLFQNVSKLRDITGELAAVLKFLGFTSVIPTIVGL